MTYKDEGRGEGMTISERNSYKKIKFHLKFNLTKMSTFAQKFY